MKSIGSLRTLPIATRKRVSINEFQCFELIVRSDSIRFHSFFLNFKEQFLYIGSNRRSNLFSLQSPIIEISDENIENINARDQSYEFRFLVITNFDGYIQVIIRQNQIESQVLKIKGNRNNEYVEQFFTLQAMKENIQ